jgi:hypothetical protein
MRHLYDAAERFNLRRSRHFARIGYDVKAAFDEAVYDCGADSLRAETRRPSFDGAASTIKRVQLLCHGRFGIRISTSISV